MHGAEHGLGESQVFVVDLQRGVESMPLPGPGVETQGDLVELVLAVDRQVRALGQILTQQAVGVLVAAALPGAVRVGEVDRHTGAQGQRVVVTHLLALIVGQRLAQGGRDALQGLAEAGQRVGSAGAAHLGQHHEAAAALDQRADRRTIAGALDQIALPVARDQPVFDLGRAHVDALPVRNLAPPVLTAAARLARAATLSQAGDELLAQLASRGHVDRAVDGLVRHPVVRPIGEGPRQYPGDLLRRPARQQQLMDHRPQRRVVELAQHPRFASTAACSPLRRLRAIDRSHHSTRAGARG